MILTIEKQISECHLSKETNTCISSKWPKNSMQFTLGMPFLGVLGKFYRNRKGITVIQYITVSGGTCYVLYVFWQLAGEICFVKVPEND